MASLLKIDAFVSRLKTSPRKAKFTEYIQGAFRIADTFAGGVADIRKNPGLNDHGRREARAKLLANGYSTWLAKIHDELKVSRDYLAKLRSEIAPELNDHNNLVLEMRQDQLRKHLKQLPEGERIQLAMQDPVMQEAVVSMPAYMSGLQQDRYDAVAQAFLERKHPAKLEQIEDLASDIEVMDSAFQVADNDIRSAADLSDQEYHDAVKAGAEAVTKPPSGSVAA